jgi:lysophospholipase L1-like esterase
MKRVLCYGDSNTWGYDPETRNRFPAEVRWTGVMAARLGSDFLIIEEGLNGRTTRWDDPIEQGKNGLSYLYPCVETHRPIDAIVLMLGTNDLKQRFGLSASDIAESAALLAEYARKHSRNAEGRPAPTLLVAPPALTTLTDLDQMFAGGTEKSRQFSHYYRLAASWYGLPFFDAGSVIVSNEKDGIHFHAEEHRTLGEALADEVRQLLS